MTRTGTVLRLVLGLLLASPVRAADETPVLLYAQDIPASELVGLLYREIFRKPFVTSPAVQANRSLVSVHISGTQAGAVSQANDYLAALGFKIVTGKGVDRVELPGPVAPPPIDSFPMFYTPKWRDPAELVALLKPLFPEARFGGTGAAVTYSDGTSAESVVSDKLVVHAAKKSLAEIKELLPRLDTPVSDLAVKAAVFEVGTNVDDGSAFQLAVGLLKSQVSVGTGAAYTSTGLGLADPTVLGSFLAFKSSSVEAIVSALSTDSRFNLVTAPAVRARSGASTSFTVGQSVPVLGSVSYPDGGGSTPVQSVEYRDAGVIFTVRPVVQDKVITMLLSQEISDFVQTTTGVNSTPTLTRRKLDTTLSLQDGDVVMLGGLTKTKDSNAKEGFSFLPDLLKSNTKTSSRTDLLLVLQVQKLQPGAVSANFDRTRAFPTLPDGKPRSASEIERAARRGEINGLF